VPALVDDRYELLEVLASGGMATVWRAQDTRLNRFVALKRPHPAPAESKLHERIAREARAAAGVSHPNLVTMFDTGRDEAGPYLVMELVSGPTLTDPGREIGSAEAVAIGADLADALAAVHRAGIVHRDVKPSNVILSDRGPRLTDFGIASPDDTSRELTLPGTIVATPSYAAPEVLAGDPPSPASDVFSLSALIHEMLSGTQLYQGANRSVQPPELTDPYINAVIQGGLAPNPTDRPTAQELAAKLRASAPTRTIAPQNSTLVMPAPNPPSPLAAPAEEIPSDEPTRDMSILPEVAPETTSDPITTPPKRQTTDSPPSQPDTGPTNRRWQVPILLLVAAVAAAAMWVARTPDAQTEPSSTSVIDPTTIPSTSIKDPVLAASERLATIMSGVGPPELKSKERAEITEKVDVAIAAAGEDPSEAVEALNEAAELIVAELDRTSEAEALAALADLARALGLDT